MSRPESRIERDEPDQLPGVVDTLGIAFTLLLRRPLIILIPLSVDAYLWLGWRLSAGDLANRLGSWIRDVFPDSDGLASAVEGQSGLNLMELVSMRLPTVRLPTFVPLLVTAESVRYEQWDPSISDLSWWILLLAAIGLLILGLLIGSEYLRGIVSIVTDQHYKADFRETLTLAYRLATWSLMALLLFLIVILPIVALQGAFVLSGIGYMGFLTLLAAIPSGLGFIVFFFAVYAIAVDRLDPLPSFKASYQLVRLHGRQSLGLIVAFLVVTGGFPFFWREMVGHPAGTLLAMIGNAFITSGMIAAACIFYRDRAHQIAPMTERY